MSIIALILCHEGLGDQSRNRNGLISTIKSFKYIVIKGTTTTYKNYMISSEHSRFIAK